MTSKPALHPGALPPLLERLVNLAIAAQHPESRRPDPGQSAPRGVRPTLHLQSVALHGGGAILRMRVRGLSRLIDGEYEVALAIEETSPQRTRCAIAFPGKPGIGRLVGLGLKAAPRRLLNEALAGVCGGALSLEGDRLVIAHDALVRALLTPPT